ncbi:calcium-activated chloride channel regulator 4A, partial [Biomphalaria glabrata]
QYLSTETEAVENFQRVTSAGEFRLRGFPPLEAVNDKMPPSRITDLRVISFNLETSVAILQWTAVGGDMERGKV